MSCCVSVSLPVSLSSCFFPSYVSRHRLLFLLSKFGAIVSVSIGLPNCFRSFNRNFHMEEQQAHKPETAAAEAAEAAVAETASQAPAA